MTEDFYNLIMETPEAERVGKVFKLFSPVNRLPDAASGSAVSWRQSVRKAGVVVATVEKQVKARTASWPPSPSRSLPVP